MVLDIAQLGQPVLRRRAVEVPTEKIDTPEFQQFVDQMFETLQAAGGVGLAGPQVFAGFRVFLAAVRMPEGDQEMAVEVFVNPRITPTSEERDAAWEGCLSFPELQVLVSRPRQVRIEYLDRQGEPRALELQGFPARVVQHEYDHLEGVLTMDRAASTHDIVKASELAAVKRHRAGQAELPGT